MLCRRAHGVDAHTLALGRHASGAGGVALATGAVTERRIGPLISESAAARVALAIELAQLEETSKDDMHAAADHLARRARRRETELLTAYISQCRRLYKANIILHRARAAAVSK